MKRVVVGKWLVGIALCGTAAFHGCGDTTREAFDDVGSGGLSGMAGNSSTDLGGGEGGGGGAAGAGGAPFEGPVLGRACDSDADCDGYHCITATSDEYQEGGPAHGYCTVECEGTADCQEFDEGAICSRPADTGGTAYCFQSCHFGPMGSLDPTDELNPAKCHGRHDVACTPLYGNNGSMAQVCLPNCNDDANCPEGKFCDKFFGNCVDSQIPGEPFGSTCVPGGPGTQCQGVCADFTDANDETIVAYCLESCTIGTLPTCGWDGENGQPRMCGPGFPGVSPDGLGDIGICYRLCDCDSECLGEQKCVEVENKRYHKDGICRYPYSDDLEPLEHLDCGEGTGGTGSGGAGSSGTASGGDLGAGGGN